MSRQFFPTNSTISRVSVVLLAVLFLTAGATSIQAQRVAQDDDTADLPTDAEVYSTLSSKILSQTRSGDVTNTVIQIPAAADTFVTSSRPDTNWSNNADLRLGYNFSNGYGAERIYLFFDVEAFIPDNATINSAFVEGYEHAFSPAGDAPMGTQLRPLNSTWDAAQITWNNHLPDWGSVFGEGEIPPTIGYVSGDVTELVREWVYGSRPNFGMIFVGDETPRDRERIFFSLNANNGLFPRLTVDYSIIQDNIPPNATVEALPRYSTSVFEVEWSGTDQGGSGIAYYDVRYRAQGGSWVDWQFHTTARSAEFQGGANGITYQFVVRAVDNAGNQQPWSDTAQASTTVDSQVPVVSVNPLPQFTAAPSFTISWSGSDNLSGIAHFDVEYNINNGSWQPLLSRTTALSTQFTGALDGNTYGFRARGTDAVGNVQPFPTTAQAATTISLGPPSASMIPFAPYITSSLTFNVRWQGQASPGATIVGYDVEYRYNEGPWQSWLNNVNTTVASFTASNGDGMYEFRVRARDNLGRVSPFSDGPGNFIIVDNSPPFIEPSTWFPALFR